MTAGQWVPVGEVTVSDPHVVTLTAELIAEALAVWQWQAGGGWTAEAELPDDLAGGLPVATTYDGGRWIVEARLSPDDSNTCELRLRPQLFLVTTTRVAGCISDKSVSTP
jgi:hypothetical protein